MVNIHLSRGVSKTTRWELSSGHQTWKSDSRKLAVVVPTHDGDVSRAFVSMGKWPHECSAVTLSHVDLILYHATVADKEKLRAGLPNHVTACFRNTKVVIADLSPEVRHGQSLGAVDGRVSEKMSRLFATNFECKEHDDE